MAKVKINWPPMSMKAEGEDAAVLAQAEQFLKYVKEAHKISFDVLPTIFRDGCRDPEELDDEDVEPLTEPEEVAPAHSGMLLQSTTTQAFPASCTASAA